MVFHISLHGMRKLTPALQNKSVRRKQEGYDNTWHRSVHNMYRLCNFGKLHSNLDHTVTTTRGRFASVNLPWFFVNNPHPNKPSHWLRLCEPFNSKENSLNKPKELVHQIILNWNTFFPAVLEWSKALSQLVPALSKQIPA